jgi:hypothetical protein
VAISQVFLDPKNGKSERWFTRLNRNARAHDINLPAEYISNKQSKTTNQHTHTQRKDTHANSVNK